MAKTTLSVAFVLAVLATGWWRPAEALALDANEMKVALATATPEEEGFIEYVLGRVEKGTLPEDLVQSTFLWARKKSIHKFQYFKRGLILRAAEKGIQL